MSPEARERFVTQVNMALSDPRLTMSEGRPHFAAKVQTTDTLGLYFRSTGRRIYIAEELSVLYPGEASFSPDVLAVRDVDQPEDDQRLAWVVADEGRGLDWVLEVLHNGDRKKDLVDNVERYAHLQIPEYFIYDKRQQRIVGYRLPAPGATSYERIVPQVGRHHSNVLDVDLVIAGGKLRFYHGMSELFGSGDWIGRLQGMVEDLEHKSNEAQAERESALSGLREAVTSMLAVRGIPCGEAATERINACNDPLVLQRWMRSAMKAGSAEEALAEGA